MVSMQDAIKVIRELVADVEAVGTEATDVEWPDLYRTYLDAKRFLREAGVDQTEGNPNVV